jgi:hypothetical protein
VIFTDPGKGFCNIQFRDDGGTGHPAELLQVQRFCIQVETTKEIRIPTSGETVNQALDQPIPKSYQNVSQPACHQHGY